MTINKTEKINSLFERIKTIGFWSRIFSWNTIRTNSIEAYNEYTNLLNEQERLYNLATKSDILIKEVSEKKLEIENLKLRLQDKEIEIVRLSEVNHNLQEKSQKLNTEISALNGTIQINQKELEQKQNNLGQLEEAKKQLNLSIQELKENISDKQGEINSFNKQIQSKESEIGKYIAQNNSSYEKITDLQKELEAYKVRQTVSQEEFNKFKGDLARYEESIEQKRSNILELEKGISSKEESNNNLQRQIQSNQNELGKLSETIEQNFKKVQDLNSTIVSQNQSIKYHQQETQEKSQEIAKLNETKTQSQNRLKEMEIEKAILKQDVDYILAENEKIKRNVATWEEKDSKRVDEHSARINTLQTVIKQMEHEKDKLHKERENEIIEKMERMSRAWKTHEDHVQKVIIEICQRHNIDYVETNKLPFKLKPDNVIYIAGEYIVFDSKCPMTDDLENFPKYIQTQTEALKKYAKEDNVKKDLFLVVPSNTISKDDSDKKYLKTFYYQMTDYRVFVVAIDSLEPIILNLKKIEEYEFAEKLSPEDRDNICRIIGKFAHTAKRKIQIDCFLNQHLGEILKECDYLSPEIQDKVVDMEKAYKLNPPQDRRGKNNSQKEIEKNIKCIGNLAELEDISIGDDLAYDFHQLALNK